MSPIPGGTENYPQGADWGRGRIKKAAGTAPIG